jgi:hypothetical protein
MKQHGAGVFDQRLRRAKNVMSPQSFLNEILSKTENIIQQSRKFKGVGEGIIDNSRSAIVALRKCNIPRFDPFATAGFKPNENSYSDVLAKLMDPFGGHGLGNLAFLYLIKSLRPYNSRQHEAISFIKNMLNSDRGMDYIVKREERRGRCIPDIVVRSESYCVFIENKIRGNKETNFNGKVQTVKYCEALQQECAREGKKWLGIYLTPEGNTPKSVDFTVLSVGTLLLYLRKALKMSQNIKCTTDKTVTNISAFLDYYDLHIRR